MMNLFEPAKVEQVKQRMARLTPESERQWGVMSPAQALAHCSVSLGWALGDTVPPRMFVGRLIGRVVKPMLLKDDKPMRRNAPTAKSLVVQDERNLAAEREKLSGMIDRFATSGQHDARTRRPHSFFGPLTPDEWAILMYKHLDHHLRQFGV